MEYILFSYPNCPKCDSLKEGLRSTGFGGEEYNLIERESKRRIREYLDVIKRDEKGGIVIPTLILQEDGVVVAVINSQEDLGDWLRSRA